MQKQIQKQLSVVIQGRVNSYTYKSILSILKHFPFCENIIISTWVEDQNYALTLKSIDSRKISLVFSEDPGSEIRRITPKEYHNINRILVSSKRGLDLAKTKYTLLIRSDLLFSSSDVLTYYQKHSEKDRILVLNHTTIDDTRVFALAFHCC